MKTTQDSATSGPRRIVPPADFAPRGLAAPAVGAPVPQLQNHGGPVLGSVEVVPIYWGVAWASGTTAQLASELDGFFDFIVTSSYMDLLSEYGTAATPIQHGRRLASVHVSASEPGTATPPSGRQVTDAQIRQALQGWIADGTAPATSANTLYFIYLPPNVVSLDFNTQSCAPGGYCGYHDHIDAVYYAVIPYVNCSGCVFAGNFLDTLTEVSSHELAEAITDPALNAWWDPNTGGDEIGDICNRQTVRLGNYLVQTEWSNAQSACVVAPVAPLAAGDPATMVTANQQHIFYRGADNHISHIFWDGSFHFDRWTASAGAPVAGGDPTVMVVGNQQHIFYRGTDGHINHIFWDGAFHFDQWTTGAGAPVAAGRPAAMVTGNQQHIFYRGMNGHINHIFWDGSFHFDQWTVGAGAPLAAGDPATMVTGNQQHVFYRGADGNINHIFWDGSFHRDQWTAGAGAPSAASDPATMVTGNQQHIFYRGTDGHINHVFWDGAFHFDRWTVGAGAPVAAGRPATMVTGNQQHIFYRGMNGHIDHIFWDGSFHFDQWTVGAGAPLAAGEPDTMVTGDQQHIFYRGTDGNINHIFWDGSFHFDQWTVRAEMNAALIG
jgi:roadblock/LC7 domain-containing protein